jgi:uncharacterized protein
MAKLETFSEEQIIQKMQFENPWWKSGCIDEYYSSMKRRLYFDIFKPLAIDSSIKRAVVLMGPRRVGKTVMLFHLVQDLIDCGYDAHKICYLSVENPIYSGISLEKLFELCRKATGNIDSKDYFVIYDEIQYLKNWEVHLKLLVDSYHYTKFIVSGSAAAALRLKSNESGAGRFTDFILPPLTFHEYINLKGLDGIIVADKKEWAGIEKSYYRTTDIDELNNHFINYINFGGYPEVSLSEQIQSNPGRYIRNDIIDKVLLRDLPSLYGIQDVQELNSLFTTIAYNSGHEFTFDDLSTSSGVAKNTIKRYIEYLEAAFLIRVVHRIDINAKKFKRANFFKIYLTNPSLRCALFSPITATDDFIGNMVETAIFSQWSHNADFLPYYARWANGEVDIVGLNNKQKPAWAVEIKWSNRFAKDIRLLGNLKSFCLKNGIDRTIVTSLTVDDQKQDADLKYDFTPASIYCYTVGRNAVQKKIMDTLSAPKNE